MEFCPRCGVRNSPGAATCLVCGSPMGVSTAAPGTMMMPRAGIPRRPKVMFRVVRADGGPEASIPMGSEILTCGRAGDLSLADDPFVAGVQLRFFFSGGKLAIEDLGGGNGVFVRLRHERELIVGGELRLGRQRLVLEAVPPPTSTVGGAIAWGSPDPGYRFRLLQLLEGGIRGAAFPLRDGENLLGRETGSVFFPQDGFVSGRHALLVVKTDTLLIRDLNSSNGTFIRLGAPAYVENGDQFLIGRQLVRVDVEEASEPAG